MSSKVMPKKVPTLFSACLALRAKSSQASDKSLSTKPKPSLSVSASSLPISASVASSPVPMLILSLNSTIAAIAPATHINGLAMEIAISCVMISASSVIVADAPAMTIGHIATSPPTASTAAHLAMVSMLSATQSKAAATFSPAPVCWLNLSTNAPKARPI